MIANCGTKWNNTNQKENHNVVDEIGDVKRCWFWWSINTLWNSRDDIGANSTIVCGIAIGQYAFIGAGALVNKEIPDYALVYGNPARIQSWMCYCGVKLNLSNSPVSQESADCINCGKKYKKEGLKVYEIS